MKTTILLVMTALIPMQKTADRIRHSVSDVYLCGLTSTQITNN